VPLQQLQAANDVPGLKLAARAARQDFRDLRVAVDELRRRIAATSNDSQDAFLRSYLLLWSLRLPDDPANWRVTDEGLQIVQWGLEAGRPLFEWSDDTFRQLEQACLRFSEPLSDQIASEDDGAARTEVRSRLASALRKTSSADSSVGRKDGPKEAAPESSRWITDPLWWSVIALVFSVGALGGFLLARRPAGGATTNPVAPQVVPEDGYSLRGTRVKTGHYARSVGGGNPASHAWIPPTSSGALQ
jgi:hypothetical protein